MVVLISADMEGATGVTSPRDVEPRAEEWHRFRHLFTADVNAVALGFLDGGIEDIIINEAHATMRNLILEELDDRVRLLTGRHKRLGMMHGVEGVDAVAFVGYHSGAGEAGVLAHTYLANSIVSVTLDGVNSSEGRLNAALAAEYGAPVILVTGDDRACADAEDYAPDAERVVVKEYVSRYAALCIPPARTFELQRDAARRAAPRAAQVSAHVTEHRMEVEFDATHLADAASMIPTVELVTARRVAFTAPTMTEAMLTFEVVATMVNHAIEDPYG